MHGLLARVLLALLALAGVLMTPAGAQTAAPALRASVTVTGNLVRIGDLVDNAGAVADVPIFRAPDLGTRGSVPTDRVIEAIRPHQLIGIDTRGLSEVIVTRASRAITAQEISTSIARALAGQYGLGAARDIAVSFDTSIRTLHVEAGATGELEVLALAYDPRTTRFDVTFDLPSSAVLRSLSPRFTGTAVETVEAVTAARSIERGEILKPSDLIIARRPKLDGATIIDIGAAVGRAARHEIRRGQPLRDADLAKPLLVQRGETVTIIYEAPRLSLTLRGQAQEAGALGDPMTVLNAQSKRVVQGVVSGRGQVTVTVTPIRFVENTSPPEQASPAPPPDLPEANRHLSSAE